MSKVMQINELPIELLFKILSYLTSSDIKNFARTSKSSHRLVSKFFPKLFDRNNTNFNSLPADIIKEILNFSPLSSIVKIKELSKKHKELMDHLITQPKNVVMIISQLHSFDTMLFLDFYTRTKQYQALLETHEQQNKTDDPWEMICIALTIDNIYKIESSNLESALIKLDKNLESRMKENLTIINKLIKFAEIEDYDNNTKNIYLAQIKQLCKYRFNHQYINLQCADLQSFSALSLVGANFKNTLLNAETLNSPHGIISQEAFLSKDKMVRELNQLAKQFNSRKDPKEKRLLRLHLFEWCVFYIFRLYKNIVPKFDKEKTEKLLELVNAIINHPLGKKTSEDKMNEASTKIGSFFRDQLNAAPQSDLYTLYDFKNSLENLIAESAPAKKL